MKIEFFNGSDGNVWYRCDNRCSMLSQDDHNIIDYMIEHISRIFPRSLQRLEYLYSSSIRNRNYYKFKIVERFIKCNMGVDNQQTYDINGDFVSLEFVVCPLRGLCKDEGILCCPKIKSSFNPAEQEVAILYASGFTIKEIALKLKKSLSTVNNQMWRITKRLGLNSRHEFIQVVKNLNLL